MRHLGYLQATRGVVISPLASAGPVIAMLEQENRALVTALLGNPMRLLTLLPQPSDDD